MSDQSFAKLLQDKYALTPLEGSFPREGSVIYRAQNSWGTNRAEVEVFEGSVDKQDAEAFSHPGVVGIRDITLDDAHHLLIIRDVATGSPLSQVIETRMAWGSPFSRDEVAFLLAPVAHAIDQLAAEGRASWAARAVNVDNILQQPDGADAPTKLALVGPTPADFAGDVDQDEHAARNRENLAVVIGQLLGAPIDRKLLNDAPTATTYLNWHLFPEHRPQQTPPSAAPAAGAAGATGSSDGNDLGSASGTASANPAGNSVGNPAGNAAGSAAAAETFIPTSGAPGGSTAIGAGAGAAGAAGAADAAGADGEGAGARGNEDLRAQWAAQSEPTRQGTWDYSATRIDSGQQRSAEAKSAVGEQPGVSWNAGNVGAAANGGAAGKLGKANKAGKAGKVSKVGKGATAGKAGKQSVGEESVVKRWAVPVAAVAAVALLAGGGFWLWSSNSGEAWSEEHQQLQEQFPNIISEKDGGKGWRDMTCSSLDAEGDQVAAIRCANNSLGVTITEYDTATERNDELPDTDFEVLEAEGKCRIRSYPMEGAEPPAFYQAPEGKNSKYLAVINGDEAETERAYLDLCG